MKLGGNPSVGVSRPSSTMAGFTIVETLIVLAVTAGLLVSCMTLISGKQAQTQFQTASNGLQQTVQQVIGEVQNGFYPNNDNFSCTAGAGTVTYGGGTGTQGKNSGCIFVGKVLQFSVGSTTFGVFPVGGYQFVPGTATTVSTLAQSTPVVAQTLSQTQNLGGIDFVKSFYNNNPVNLIPGNSFGVFSGDKTGSFASTAVGGGFNSGSQQFSLYVVTNPGICPSSDIKLYEYPSSGGTRCVKNVSSVSYCLTGGANLSALITIGGSGGLDVSKKNFNGVTC